METSAENRNKAKNIWIGIGVFVAILVLIGVVGSVNKKQSVQSANETRANVSTIPLASASPISAVTTKPSDIKKPTLEQATVVSVTDGDTIKVNYRGKNENIRMIGIDTPEVVDPRKVVQCFGQEASQFSKSTLKPQMSIWLEADATQDDRDKYDRLLRYVWIKNDSSLLENNFNYVLVRSGFANEYTYQSNPYKYQGDFLEAANDARTEQKGLWNPTTCGGNTTKAAITPTKVPTKVSTLSPTKSNFIAPIAPVQQSGSFQCDCSKTCPNLSCSEAQYQLTTCGCSARDGDDDGVACDAQCQ